MMLNGQDMSETVTPLQVPYSWLIDWNKEFIGSTVLKVQKNSGIKKKLAGLEMTGRGIARHGYKVFNREREIGVVTSGTFAPTLNKPVGLAFIDIAFSAPETEISIEIRDSMNGAKIVKLPFYKRPK
jgi:aminomethyltransferase